MLRWAHRNHSLGCPKHFKLLNMKIVCTKTLLILTYDIINKNSADVDVAPALGKIITNLLSQWSVKCREKSCMLAEYVKDNFYASPIRTEKHTLVFYLM